MGHSWSSNVPDMGLGDWGIGLAARYLDGPANMYLTNKGGSVYWWFVFLPTGPDQAYAELVQFPLPGYPTRFPYGLNVPPDVPM